MDLATSRTGLVTHRLMRAIGDADDPGRLPDAAVVDGARCVFKGSITRLRVDAPPTTVSLASIECAYDAAGYLYLPGLVDVDAEGMVAEADRGVYLVASDEGVEPGWTWMATITAPGLATITTNFALLGGSSVDLSTVVPVPSSLGASLVEWAQTVADAESARDEAVTAAGSAVDAKLAAETAVADAESARDEAVTAKTDAQTAQAAAVTAQTAAEAARDASNTFPVTSGLSWSGAVSLSYTVDRLLRATLTGNVTLTLPTPDSSKAYMLTLVLVQDATGSRTLTVTGAKWAYGVAAVLSTAAGSIDVIHLLWTGTAWVGLVAAQAVA